MSQPKSQTQIARGVVVAGKYKLLQPLGKGAMGVVWSATHVATEREVALKFISRPDPELRLRLQREARNCAALGHRNVVDIFDRGETEPGEPFLVMELLSGETLADLLARRRKLDPRMAAEIGRDIARGLAAAHACHIVHRDLKPANIFLHREPDQEAPVVKVLDFGVAKNLAVNDGLHTMTGGAVGSQPYMSPEQISAGASVDHRADIWALGVVLFEMLTGERPFQGDAQAVCMGILSGEIPTVHQRVWHIDAALVDLVSRCMRRDREERFDAAAEVAARLDRLAAPGARTAMIAQAEAARASPASVAGEAPPIASAPADLSRHDTGGASMALRTASGRSWDPRRISPVPLPSEAGRVVVASDARRELPPSRGGDRPSSPADLPTRYSRGGTAASISPVGVSTTSPVGVFTTPPPSWMPEPQAKLPASIAKPQAKLPASIATNAAGWESASSTALPRKSEVSTTTPLVTRSVEASRSGQLSSSQGSVPSEHGDGRRAKKAIVVVATGVLFACAAGGALKLLRHGRSPAETARTATAVAVAQAHAAASRRAPAANDSASGARDHGSAVSAPPAPAQQGASTTGGPGATDTTLTPPAPVRSTATPQQRRPSSGGALDGTGSRRPATGTGSTPRARPAEKAAAPPSPKPREKLLPDWGFTETGPGSRR
jgi:eukaryotic-like serine/threonine-protein kinase